MNDKEDKKTSPTSHTGDGLTLDKLKEFMSINIPMWGVLLLVIVLWWLYK